MSIQQKIFGIGFHRTGTSSLNDALQRVGLNAIHWPSQYQSQMREGMSNAERLAILAPCLAEYNGFTDVPFSGLYHVLDRTYSGSRFILTKRDPESWWQSLIPHWRLCEGTRQLKPFELIQYNQYEPYTTQATLADKEIFMAKFTAHNQAVINYFADRPDDLLIIDWKSDDHPFSWEKLCAFLGKGLPEDRAVPHYKQGANINA